MEAFLRFYLEAHQYTPVFVAFPGDAAIAQRDAAVGDVLQRAFGLTLGRTVNLDVLAAGGAGPAHLIIGGGRTPTPMARSRATQRTTPFIFIDAVFIFEALKVSPTTTISSGTFSFGTTEGANVVRGVPFASIPEPGFFAVLTLVVGAVDGGSARTPDGLLRQLRGG